MGYVKYIVGIEIRKILIKSNKIKKQPDNPRAAKKMRPGIHSAGTNFSTSEGSDDSAQSFDQHRFAGIVIVIFDHNFISGNFEHGKTGDGYGFVDFKNREFKTFHIIESGFESFLVDLLFPELLAVSIKSGQKDFRFARNSSYY